MKTTLSVLVAAMALVAAFSAAAQQQAPTEAQCRQMVDGMVQLAKTAPVKTERDKKDAQAILERVEKIVKDNRARGAPECDSWRAVGKFAVGQ